MGANLSPDGAKIYASVPGKEISVGNNQNYEVSLDIPVTKNVSVGMKANPQKIVNTYKSKEYQKQSSDINSSYSPKQGVIVPFIY